MKRLCKTGLITTLAAMSAGTGVVACSPVRRTASVAVTKTPKPGPLTPAVAAEAFRAFVRNEHLARVAGDERLALSWTSDGRSQLTAADFRRAFAADRPAPRYRYDKVVRYVPRLKGFPHWFVVSARRTTEHGKHPHTVLMGFIRPKPTDRWRLSLSTTLRKKADLPKIVVDDDGYAVPLATFDASLTIQPRLVPSIQATLAEEGPSSVAANVMRTAKYTSHYYTADRKKKKKKKKKSGLGYDVVYAATSFPIFPLRTKDGGGLVLYALTRDTVTKRTGKPAKKETTEPEKKTRTDAKKHDKDKDKPDEDKPDQVPIPHAAKALIDPDTVHDELNVAETHQYAAVVPAKSTRKSTDADKTIIIAFDGGVIRATVPTR